MQWKQFSFQNLNTIYRRPASDSGNNNNNNKSSTDDFLSTEFSEIEWITIVGTADTSTYLTNSIMGIKVENIGINIELFILIRKCCAAILKKAVHIRS